MKAEGEHLRFLSQGLRAAADRRAAADCPADPCGAPGPRYAHRHGSHDTGPRPVRLPATQKGMK